MNGKGSTWNRAAFNLLARMRAIGRARALEEELASPQLPGDQDWCAFVVAESVRGPRRALIRRYDPNNDPVGSSACGTCGGSGKRVTFDHNGNAYGVPCYCTLRRRTASEVED